jgi:hypothetical protein
MLERIKMVTGQIFKKMGYIVSIKSTKNPFDIDMDSEFKKIYFKSQPHTMTSLLRMNALHKAVQYTADNNIPGDIVECGVWQGGSMMVGALTLINKKDTEKKLYLYDTFEGMSEPTEKDTRHGKSVADRWKEMQDDGFNKWDYSPLEEVQKNIFSTGYPKEKIHFIKGKVEDTIPQTIPDKISVLRLDTDWYESTYHELKHLFPKLSVGGVLIIDDYGHWEGARQAVDQYFKENNIPMLLNRIDYTGRIGVKTA